MTIDGLVVPVPTLFSEDGELDRAANARFGRSLCEASVDHLFLLGSLGEFTIVEDAERAALLESVIETIVGRTDAWVGCGSPSPARSVRYARAAEEAGAAAVVAFPPYYLRPTEAEIAQYYRAIHESVRIPLLAYNIPSMVGYALSPALLHRLGAEGTLAGVKDTAGAIESVSAFLTDAPPGWAVLPGNDVLAVEAIRRGAVGAVMGMANIVPRLAVELVRAARSHDQARADALHALVVALAAVAATGPFPSTDKYLAQKVRGVAVGYRHPYGPLTEEERARVDRAWAGVEERLRPFLGEHRA